MTRSPMRQSKFSLLALLCALPLTVAQEGCEDDAYDPGLHTEEHACVHMEEGPAESVEASTTAANAPDTSEHHTRYDIEMVNYEGGLGGYTSFEPDGHGILLLFADQPVEVQLYDEGLDPVPFEDERPSAAVCDAIRARYVAHVDRGRYFLEWGPTGVPATVSLVIEEGQDGH